MLLDDLIHTRLAVCCASAEEYDQIDQLLKDSADFEFPENISPVDDEEAENNPYYFVTPNGEPMYERTFERLHYKYASMEREISFHDFMEGVRFEQALLPDVTIACSDLSDIL